MSILYHLGIYLYNALLHVLSFLGHRKASQWVNGRKKWKQRLLDKFKGNNSCIWFHCASLGEYELSVPLMERIKQEYPRKNIVVTFFSPSGYEIKKNDPLAFHTDYLPIDSASNALFFIETIKPEMALFAKYDYWHYYLKVLQSRHVPTYVFSATFRSSQVFFQFYGDWYKRMLERFTLLFVTNENSRQLLVNSGIQQVVVTGDNRYDRVLSTAKQKRNFPFIEKFKQDYQLLIIGSSWPEDEAVLASFINKKMSSVKCIIAPHEINEGHLHQLEQLLTVKCIRYSVIQETTVLEDVDVIIIDNIGMLSSLYKYGNIAYVGGAFKQGLHNILEPLSFGLPVVFGPEYKKYPEALDFISIGSAYSIANEYSLKQTLYALLDSALQEQIKKTTTVEIEKHRGATEKIMKLLAWKN